MKNYNRRVDNTVGTLYKRFMEHFHAWDSGKMSDKEWEIIRRGFEAQAKILGNLVRVISFSSEDSREFKDMCVSFGVLPDDIQKILIKKDVPEIEEK